jgi:hypothetical protein
MTKPEHLGIEYVSPRWADLYEPKPIRFEQANDSGRSMVYENVMIGDVIVGSLEPRPYYCDRGRYIFRSELPDLDGADGFPRYYMDYSAACAEITAWLRWRLWRAR